MSKELARKICVAIQRRCNCSQFKKFVTDTGSCHYHEQLYSLSFVGCFHCNGLCCVVLSLFQHFHSRS